MRYWKGKDSFVVIPESFEDIWLLSEIIKVGDIIGAKTSRKVILNFGDRKEVEERQVFLKIKVEKVKFDKFTQELKFLGKIVESKEFKGYHTIRASIGKKIEVYRELSPEEEELLKESLIERPRVVIVAIDDEEALIFDSKTGQKISLRHAKPPKDSEDYEQSLKSFLSKVKAEIEKIQAKNLIIAGPGFVKERLRAILGFGRVIGTSYAGEAGLREVFARKEVERVLEKVREAEEERKVQEILEELSKGKAIAIGLEAVREASLQGRIEELIISSKFIREQLLKNRLTEVREIIRNVRNARGKIYVVYRNEDALAKLSGLGGIAAKLRW